MNTLATADRKQLALNIKTGRLVNAADDSSHIGLNVASAYYLLLHIIYRYTIATAIVEL